VKRHHYPQLPSVDVSDAGCYNALMTQEKPKRRWYQFSLRMLLVLVTVIAASLGWLMRERRWIAEQQEVLKSKVWTVVHTEPTWRDQFWGYDQTHYTKRIITNTI